MVDIFEAETLRSQVMRALDDANADSVAIDLAHLESVDITALQILLALRGGVVAVGRKFVITNPPPAFTKTLVELDLAARI
jgi:anti-anti-sigma regulatory factor